MEEERYGLWKESEVEEGHDEGGKKRVRKKERRRREVIG